MKIKLFTIPNILTLMNLLCGTLAIKEVISSQNFSSALWLLLIAAIFDFLDGFAARALGQYSAIGAELDSLADMVSFGLAPAMILLYLYNLSVPIFMGSELASSLQYICLAVALFAALRLAKFNIDATQSEEFSGLPTPAAALFVASLGVLVEQERLFLSQEFLAFVALSLSLLMVSNIPMLALKFKGFALRDNALRYGFMLLSLALIAWLGVLSVPAIFLLYLFVAFVQLITRSRG